MKRLGIIFLGLLLCNLGFAQQSGDASIAGTSSTSSTAGTTSASSKDNSGNEFSISAQVRPRAEYRDGEGYPLPDGSNAAGFVTNRSRLSMDYKRSNLEIGFSAQNVNVWGQDAQVEKNGRFMLNESWVSLTPGGGFFVKAGRQILAYDDERLLGALDWNMSGRSHDALKLGYEDKQNKLHGIFAFNQNAENFKETYYAPGGQPYKTMQTLWYQHIGSKEFNVSLIFMNLGIQSDSSLSKISSIKYLQTFGGNLLYQPGAFRLYGTVYYQTGQTVIGKTTKDVAAYMGALNLSYQMDPAWKITAISEYLSGDAGKSNYTAFNPLYGTHHLFYGSMDYFYTNPFVGGYNPGLWDNQLGLNFKTSPKVNLSLFYHYLQTTADIVSNNVTLKHGALGSEWDFQFGWNVMKDVTMTGGYSAMFANNALMKAVKGGDPSKMQNWVWLTLNVNPKIFSSKW